MSTTNEQLLERIKKLESEKTASMLSITQLTTTVSKQNKTIKNLLSTFDKLTDRFSDNLGSQFELFEQNNTRTDKMETQIKNIELQSSTDSLSIAQLTSNCKRQNDVIKNLNDTLNELVTKWNEDLKLKLEDAIIKSNSSWDNL